MKTNPYYSLLAVICLMLAVLTSCSKSDDPQPQAIDPNDIISGTYTMSYLASGSNQFNLPLTDGGTTLSGTVTFSRLSSTSSSFRMVLNVSGTSTALADETVTAYVKLLNPTTVGLYNDAAMTSQVGTGTKNLIDIKITSSNGQTAAMKAIR